MAAVWTGPAFPVAVAAEEAALDTLLKPLEAEERAELMLEAAPPVAVESWELREAALELTEEAAEADDEETELEMLLAWEEIELPIEDAADAAEEDAERPADVGLTLVVSASPVVWAWRDS